MYVKVHKKDDYWYRSDTGELVGYSVPLKDSFILRSMYGDKLFAKNDQNVFVIYHGYFNNNTFYHFCKNFSNCYRCNLATKNIFCGKDVRDGYYIKI